MLRNGLGCVTVLVFLVSAGLTMAEDKATTVKTPSAPGQHPQQFEREITLRVKLNYLLFLPEGYDKGTERWPLLVFLHGAGETGNDLNQVKKHGPPKIVETRKDFPFVVVSPQAPRLGWNVETLNALLDDVLAKHRIDPDRVYLTGLSMGGYGTWAWAAAHPERFAAIVPICGGGDSSEAAKIRAIPTWVFHGARDNAVPLRQSQMMVDALKKAGGQPKFTVYPEAGHDSWTETYNNPELYTWLLKQRRQLTTWTGTWQQHDKPDHGGDLKCVARAIDDTHYSAAFSGYCGQAFVFQVQMTGTKDGDRIKFEGNVDLGEKNGGQYHWTGEIRGETFTGRYTTADGKKGEFSMKQVKSGNSTTGPTGQR